jgi:hypothetical protein
MNMSTKCVDDFIYMRMGYRLRLGISDDGVNFWRGCPHGSSSGGCRPGGPISIGLGKADLECQLLHVLGIRVL